MSVSVLTLQQISRTVCARSKICALQDVPRLEIPLHTLIELVPTPDGRMAEERVPFNIRKSMDLPPRTQMEKQFSEMITLSINRDAA